MCLPNPRFLLGSVLTTHLPRAQAGPTETTTGRSRPVERPDRPQDATATRVILQTANLLSKKTKIYIPRCLKCPEVADRCPEVLRAARRGCSSDLATVTNGIIHMMVLFLFSKWLR